MASLQKYQQNGKTHYRKQYYRNGKRITIRFGQLSQKIAAQVALHLDHLIKCQKYGLSIDEKTVDWLRSTDEQIVGKMAKYGLCRVMTQPTIAKFVADFIDSKIDAKPRTVVTYRRVEKHLNDYFPSGKRIDEVTTQDARKFSAWLRTSMKLNKNTTARRCGIARQFFNAALEDELLNKNPFRHVSVAVGVAKKEYVDWSVIDKVVEHSTGEWRLLFVMSRSIPMRIPSEFQNLVWNDINFDNNTILLKASKTDSERLVPIFPELKPYLEDHHELARGGDLYVDGNEFVFPKLRTHSNVATTAQKYVKRAKQTVWKNFWNSLRATRESELMDEYGLRRACTWSGNSPEIAMKNYKIVRKQDYIDLGATNSNKSDAKSDAVRARMDENGDNQEPKNAGIPITSVESIGRAGLEPATKGL